MASETVDIIDWSHPQPSCAVLPERLLHCINRCSSATAGIRSCNLATFSMRGNHLAYASTQGMKLMSDLPEDKLASTPPFQNVGIYVFGPYNISNGSSTRRSVGTMKIWVLIFVCSSSRTIHLEPLDILDTVSFSLALRRFMSLR